MARQIDPDNLDADDIAYIEQRQWIIDELNFQGYDYDSLKAAALGEEQPDSSDDDSADDDDDSDPDEEQDEDYEDLDFAALKEEIDSRNADREDDSKISKGGGAEDLRERLIADDAAGDEDDE